MSTPTTDSKQSKPLTFRFSVSEIPRVKVHTRFDQKSKSYIPIEACYKPTKGKNRCARKHTYLDSKDTREQALRFKAQYLEDFQVKDVTVYDLFDKGFSSYVYSTPNPQTLPDYMRTSFDYAHTYRHRDTAVALLPSHWLDLDNKQGQADFPSQEELLARWKASDVLQHTAVAITVSASGKGLRLLYNGSAIPELTDPNEGTALLKAEQELIVKELGVEDFWDSTKCAPSSHSSHLRLKDSDITYPDPLEYVPDDPQPLQVTYEYSPLQDVPSMTVTSYNKDHFAEQSLTPSPAIPVQQYATLPPSFVLVNSEGPISVPELVLQCLERQSGHRTEVATNSPFGQTRQHNSRFESTFWQYDEKRGLLIGTELGETSKSLLAERGITVDQIVITIPYRIKLVAFPPSSAVELSDNLYMDNGKLVRTVPFATRHTELFVSTAEAHTLNVDLWAELWPNLLYSIDGKRDFFSIVPDATLQGKPIGLKSYYTLRQLLDHLDNMGFHLLGSLPRQAATDPQAKRAYTSALSKLGTFITSNKAPLEGIQKEFGYPKGTPPLISGTIDSDAGSIQVKAFLPCVPLSKPRYEHPGEDALIAMDKYLIKYAGYNTDQDARHITACMYDILPDGVRYRITYNNIGAGKFKSSIMQAKQAIGIVSPKTLEEIVGDTELLGAKLESYAMYRSNILDEAQAYKQSKVRKLILDACFMGITGRKAHGTTETVTFKHIEIASAEGLKMLDRDVIDSQLKDRIVRKESPRDGRKIKDLLASGIVPEHNGVVLDNYDKREAALQWLLYEKFKHYEEKWDRHTVLTDELDDIIKSARGSAIEARLALTALSYGIKKLKEHFEYYEGDRTTNGKQYLVRPKGYTEDQIVGYTQKPYSLKKDPTYGPEMTFEDGIYIDHHGCIQIDGINVIFDMIEDLDMPLNLKTLVKHSKQEIIKMLGYSDGSRKAKPVAAMMPEHYTKYAYIAVFIIPPDQLKAILTETYTVPEKLVEMGLTTEDIEHMYEQFALSGSVPARYKVDLLMHYIDKMSVEVVIEEPEEEEVTKDLPW